MFTEGCCGSIFRSSFQYWAGRGRHTLDRVLSASSIDADRNLLKLEACRAPPGGRHQAKKSSPGQIFGQKKLTPPISNDLPWFVKSCDLRLLMTNRGESKEEIPQDEWKVACSNSFWLTVVSQEELEHAISLLLTHCGLSLIIRHSNFWVFWQTMVSHWKSEASTFPMWNS